MINIFYHVHILVKSKFNPCNKICLIDLVDLEFSSPYIEHKVNISKK